MQPIPLLGEEGFAKPKVLVVKHSPPSIGGVDARYRKCREASLAAQTGWSSRHGCFCLYSQAIFKTDRQPTTPSAASMWLRNFFLMPQPPLLYQEGSSPVMERSPFEGGQSLILVPVQFFQQPANPL